MRDVEGTEGIALPQHNTTRARTRRQDLLLLCSPKHTTPMHTFTDRVPHRSVHRECLRVVHICRCAQTAWIGSACMQSGLLARARMHCAGTPSIAFLCVWPGPRKQAKASTLLGGMCRTEFGEWLERLLPRAGSGCRNKQATKNHLLHILRMRLPRKTQNR